MRRDEFRDRRDVLAKPAPGVACSSCGSQERVALVRRGTRDEPEEVALCARCRMQAREAGTR